MVRFVLRPVVTALLGVLASVGVFCLGLRCFGLL